MKSNNLLQLIPVLIPTEEKTQLVMFPDGILFLRNEPRRGTSENHHLYLTSNREIKEGDYFYNNETEVIGKSNEDVYKKLFPECLKIEFTTNPILIEDGVPVINEDTRAWKEFPFPFRASKQINFIEEFIKIYNKIKINDEIGKIPAYETGLTAEESGQEGIKIEITCELHPRPITCGHNELGEEGKDWEWSVEPFEGTPLIYFGNSI